MADDTDNTEDTEDTSDTEDNAGSEDTSGTAAPSNLTPHEQRLADYWHGQGMSNAGVAGILGATSQESNSDPNAFNESSGASGTYQYTGSRAKGVIDYATARGKDPWDPEVQDEYANGEVRGQIPTGGLPAGFGDKMFHAQDAAGAADNWVRGFERPGDATDSESARAQARAQRYMASLETRYGGGIGNASGGPPVVAPVSQETLDPKVTSSAQRFLQEASTPPAPGGKFDHVSLPATQTAPHNDHVLDSSRAFLGGPSPAPAPSPGLTSGLPAPQGGTPSLGPAGTAPPPPPPPGTSVSKDVEGYGTVTHALSTIPGQLLSGAAWLPTHLIDGWNTIQHYYGNHPDAAFASLGGVGSTGLPDTIDPNTQGASKNPHAQDGMNVVNHIPILGPLATGNVPGGAADFQNWSQGHGIETRSPAEYGDPNILDNMVAGGANMVGAAFQPGGITRDVVAGKSLLSMVWRHIAEPALLEPGAMIGEDLAGRMTSDPRAQTAAQVGAIPLALGARGAMLYGIEKAAKLGLTTFSKAAAGARGDALASGALDKAFVSEAGGGPSATPAENTVARTEADKAKLAAAAQLGSGNIHYEVGGAGEALPPGTTAPAALLTSSAPLQKMTYNILHRGDEVQNHFVTQDQPRNILAMNAMRPQGDAQDAVQAVQNHQTATQQAISMRIAQAETDANQKLAGLRVGTAGQRLEPNDVNNEYDLASAFVDELKHARDDASTMVDDGYNVARGQGQLDATHTTPQLYTSLENVVQQALQRGNLPRDIPTAEIASLYKDGNPSGMFDIQGNRDPVTMGGQFTAGANAAYPREMTIDRALSLESNLGNSYRQEQDKLTAADGSGSRIRLANLAAMKSAVSQWVEQATLLNGNYASLRMARDQAALFHTNFEKGYIGDLLNGTSTTNPAKAVSRYLGTSQYASQLASELQVVLQNRTGAAAARDSVMPGTFDPQAPGMGTGLPGVGGNPGTPPVQQTKNVIADYLHQSYLNARTANGKQIGTAWLANRQPFFDKMTGDPTFDQLHSTLLEYQNQLDHELPKVKAYDEADLDRVQNSAAQEFLGGEAGPRLDAVLNGKNPVSGMQEILGIVRNGGVNAYRGFQAMLWDRALKAGELQSPTTMGSTTSGAQIQKWLAQPGVKAAYDVARKDDPTWAASFDKMVNGAALQDRLNVAPSVALPPEAQAATGGGVGMDLAQALTRILVTKGVEHTGLLHGTGLQGAAITSSLTGKWFPQISSAIANLTGRVDPSTAARMAMRQALQDPEKLRALLAPINGGPNQMKWSIGLEPWVQAMGIEIAKNELTPDQPTPNLGEGTVTP